MHYICWAYVGTRALTYLLTYLHSWLGEYKIGDISETVEDRAKVTINGNCLYKVVHGLSIAAKIYDLEWPLSEIQGRRFIKCRKNGEIQLSNDFDAMQSHLPLVSPKRIYTVWIVLLITAASRGLRCYCTPLVFTYYTTVLFIIVTA